MGQARERLRDNAELADSTSFLMVSRRVSTRRPFFGQLIIAKHPSLQHITHWTVHGPHPSADEMDAIFDSTVDMQDVFRDDDINMDAPIEPPAAQPKTKDDGDTLGLEEEVKVTRKRQPVAKLDEDRLVLSLGVLIVTLIHPQASIASRDSKATANREGTSPFQRKRSRGSSPRSYLSSDIDPVRSIEIWLAC